MNKVLSNKIYYATFIMALLVIAIHSSYVTFLDPNVSGYSFGLITQRLFLTLGDSAVPTFFVISGYLLFNNFVLKNYPKMLLKKLFSLVIPYFIWSVIGFLFLRIITPSIKHEAIELSFQSVALDILLSNGNPQVWFIRTLAVFCVCSPLVYFVLKYLKKWSIFIPVTVFIVYIFFRPKYDGILFWIPLFFVGCYLAYFKIPIMNAFRQRLFGAIALVLLLVAVTLFSIFNVDQMSTIYFIFRHLSVPLLWLSLDLFLSLYLKDKVSDIFKLSGFMFFSHYLLARLMENLLLIGISVNNYSCVLLFFLTWIGSSILCVSLGYVLKRFANPFYRFIGGR